MWAVVQDGVRSGAREVGWWVGVDVWWSWICVIFEFDFVSLGGV